MTAKGLRIQKGMAAIVFTAAIAGLALAGGLIAPAAGDEARPAVEAPIPRQQSSVVAPEKVESLVRWIGRHVDYDIAITVATPPKIVLCSPGDTITSHGERLSVDRHLAGAYDCARREIHLVEPWSASDLRDLSTLLHELVHDVQYLNREWPCPGEAEREAYALQAAWLDEQGLVSDLPRLQILIRSRCRDIHP